MDEKTLKYLDPNFKESREKIESLEQIIYRLNKYIRSPEELNESFLNFLIEAISKILKHPIVSGQKGDELASDLIFRSTKLFMNFIEKGLSTKKSVSSLLFKLIETIFNKYYNHSFFVTKEKEKNLIKGTHKELSYDDFNKFFQSDFEKIGNDNRNIDKNDIVDIYVYRTLPYNKKYKKEWTRGKVSDIFDEGDKKEYIIRSFLTLGSDIISGIKIPSKSNTIDYQKVNTKYLYKRLDYFTKDTKVDVCIDKDKEKIWCTGVIVDDGKSELEKDNDFKYIIYKVSYEDNNNKSNNIYDEKESMEFPYDSNKIQKYKTYSDIQKKYFKMLEEKNKEIANNYEDLLNFTFEILENDQNIESLYEYVAPDLEDKNNKNKTNYIIGKYEKNFSFYFSKILKAMADNNYFKNLISILEIDDKNKNEQQLKRGKPTIDEIKTIFCILINCHAFIHREYYDRYYKNFESAVFNVIQNEEEKNNMKKEDFDFFIFFLVKIKYILNYNNFDFSLSEQINELYIKFGIEMFKSDIYNIRDIGLKMILECVHYSLDDEENEKILEILEKVDRNSNFIELLFKNYNTNFISKSYNIIELMLKNKKFKKENIELIWKKLNENKSDLDLEKSIIDLFEYLLDHLKQKKKKSEDFCEDLLKIIIKQKNIIPNDDLYKLINKLATEGNGNTEEQIKCCEYFTEKILKEEDINNLKNNYFLNEVKKYFSRGENFYKQITKQFIQHLKKEGKTPQNILIVFSAFHNILEDQKEIPNIKEIISQDEFTELFKKNFSSYKEYEQKKDLKNNSQELIEHKNNMKIFIDFLMEIFPKLFKNQDYINLLKEISLDSNIHETDQQIFYDYIKIFVESKTEDEDKEYKNNKEKEIFKIIDGQKDKMKLTLEQIKLYIKIFIDINIFSGTLIKIEDKLIKNENYEWDAIEYLDKLWNTYIQINNQELSNELCLFIYKLYFDNNRDIQLLENCVNGIKKINYDINDNVNDNDSILQKYIDMINYIITQEEKGKYIHIKSHSDILKEYIVNIPIILNNQNSANKFAEATKIKTDLFFGNTNLYELEILLHKKYDNFASDINITLEDSEKLNKSYLTLNSINDINKIIFKGKEIKSLPFVLDKKLNPKFKSMLTEWFKHFSNGKNTMNKDDMEKFVEEINDKEGKLKIKYDEKNNFTEEDFINFYEKLSRDEPDIVWENIEKMKYLKNFEKIKENDIQEINNINNLTRYKLGNDKILYDKLIQIFNKTKKQNIIYEFLNTLSTNEKIYNEILDEFDQILNTEKNCLEFSYEFTIIESIIQDLILSQLDINEIFNIKEDEKDKIHFIKYLPFDDDNHLIRKKKFMINFINKGNNYIEKLLDLIIDILNKDEEFDLDFMNNLFIKLLKIIDFMQNIFDQKLFYEINTVIDSVYYLNGHNKIDKKKMLNSDIEITDEQVSAFNLIIMKLFNLFFHHKNIFDEKVYIHTFNIILNLKNFEETIMDKEPNIAQDYEEDYENVEDEGIEITIYDLLNDNMNNNNNSKFMTSFGQYMNKLSKLKIEYNEINNEENPSALYEVAQDVMINFIDNFIKNDIDFDNSDSNVNYLYFFSNLIKIFPINLDLFPLKNIISSIKSYLKDKSYMEIFFFAFMDLLSSVITKEKTKILKNQDNKKSIKGIYESIKKIILEENIINKVKMKLKELNNIKKGMLPYKEIKEFFDYINNKTEGENIIETTFHIYKNFIISFCDNSALSEIIKQLLQNIENFKVKEDSETKGKIMGFMGLKKNENLFYINSILQQFNYIHIFRDAIISIDVEEKINEYKMLKELQEMFTFMKYSENKIYDSNKFCDCFIDEIFNEEKREGVTFLDIFFKKLKNGLENTKFKYMIEDLFKITLCTSYKCKECGRIDDTFVRHDFITLEVKGYANLKDSLNHKFLQEETISRCERCQKDTEKLKKLSISKLPNVIIFHLNRIRDNYEYGEKLPEKIDDKFEFEIPSLDLGNLDNYKNICSENDIISETRGNSNQIYKRDEEYYKYELKGIVTYSGNTESGEYNSMLKTENPDEWIQFSDENYSKLDEGTVEYLSYGNPNEFGMPAAYLLIYQRQKQYPIRILDNNVNNKENMEFNNKYISYKNEVKDEINKNFDISRLVDEKEKIKDLKNYTFYDENLKETYSKLLFEEIEIQVPKILFIQIIEENNKYFRKNDIDEYKKCEFKFRLIILDAINSKDFFLFNNTNFNYKDIEKLIFFFNKQIFENKLNETKNLNQPQNNEQNKDFKKYIKIFLEKLLFPMLDIENKTNEIYKLISIIGEILLSNIEQILEFKNNKRIFDNSTIKKFLKIIYKIISILINKKDYNKNLDFKKFFNTFFNLTKKYTEVNYTNNTSLSLTDNEQVHQNLLCLYECLKDLIKLNNNNMFKISIDILLRILKQINYNDLRIIIYEIISALIKDNNKFNKLEKISEILDENLIKKIFKENSELLTEILLRIDYKNIEEKNKVNDLIIPFLFNYALKSNQLENLLELLFKVINIKDEYILERLYLIMGFPQIIIEKQNYFEKPDEDKDMTLEVTDQKKINFFPKFGNSYRRQYHTDEIYKYVSTMKLYEPHCILAILFPCKDYLYENQNFIEGEQKLSDEEKPKYIYRLLSIALLNEGNYCLFKYFYLTQSRNIIKYKNLYEEMIAILSNDVNNNYNLNEIKNNADICSKRIEYELGEKKDLNEPPELPENIRKTFIEYEDVKEFNGFIPKQIPDQVVYVVYKVTSFSSESMNIFLNYYTTYKDLETLRNIEKNNGEIEEEIRDNDNNIEKEEEEDDDGTIYLNIGDDEKNEIKIGKNEHSFLINNYTSLEENRTSFIQINDGTLKNNKNVKSFLLRVIFYNNKNTDTLFKDIIVRDGKEKYNNNYFIPGFNNIGYTKEKSYGEIISIYRKNSDNNFPDNIIDYLYIINKNKITFHTENYFSGNDK